MTRHFRTNWHGGFAAGSIGPAGVNGARAWWDVSLLTQGDGTEIVSLADLSGSGNDAGKLNNVNNGAAGPTCKTAIQNGLRIARFDGTKTNLGKSFGIDGPKSTVFMVLATREATPYVTRKNIAGYSVSSTTYLNTLNSSGDKFEMQATISGSALAAPPAINTFHVITLKVPGGSLPDGGIYYDGTLQVAGVHFIDPPFDMGGWSIGGAPGGNNQNATDIGEVVVYPKFLTTTEQQAVEAYLKAKWATP